MRRWELSCLLCGRYDGTDLVAMQEHARREHFITPDQLRRSIRHGPERLGADVEQYEWQLPDELPWGPQTWLRGVCRPVEEEG